MWRRGADVHCLCCWLGAVPDALYYVRLVLAPSGCRYLIDVRLVPCLDVAMCTVAIGGSGTLRAHLLLW